MNFKIKQINRLKEVRRQRSGLYTKSTTIDPQVGGGGTLIFSYIEGLRGRNEVDKVPLACKDVMIP